MQRCAFNIRLFGTCVLVHWPFLLALPVCWLVMRSGSAGYLAFLSLLALCLAHEFGHAALVRYCGLKVERIELHFLQGSCVYAKAEHDIEHVLIAWGGVLVQVALLLVFLILYQGALLLPRPAFVFLEPIFAVSIAWNAVSLFVNLLPMEGMDGAIAWRIIPAIVDGTCAGYWRARRGAGAHRRSAHTLSARKSDGESAGFSRTQS
jgi:Zn-dependent protease